jgi:hypothetical protein
MGRVELKLDIIKQIPVVGGEVDVLKSIQLLPGVQSTRSNEASDAFSPSQNLASNIQGEGGIGIWAGYAESIDTVYIP